MTNDVMTTMANAVVNYNLAAVKQTVELQKNLYHGFVELNKSLFEMSPAKDLFTSFKL